MPDARTIDQLTTEELASVPMCLVDVSDRCAFDADYKCTKADILNNEEAHGSIPFGSIVIIRTGWASKYYNDRFAYYNAQNPNDVDDGAARPRALQVHFNL